MTGEEKSLLMEITGTNFINSFDVTYQGRSKEEAACVLLGTIGGAISYLLVLKIPAEGIKRSINSLIDDMTGTDN